MSYEKELSTDEILELLDLAHNLCVTLKEGCDLCYEIDAQTVHSKSHTNDAEVTYEDYMVAAYRYYKHKLDWFWFSKSPTLAYFKRLRPKWHFFTGGDFERLIGAVLYIVTDKKFSLTQGSYDNGIDLVYDEGFSFNGTTIKALSIVQCKLYSGTVPTPEFREFFGVMTSQCAIGYFFTTGKLTSSGRKFLLSANASPHANSFYCIEGDNMEELFSVCDEIVILYDQLDAVQSDDSEFDQIYSEIYKLKDKAKAIMVGR